MNFTDTGVNVTHIYSKPNQEGKFKVVINNVN